MDPEAYDNPRLDAAQMSLEEIRELIPEEAAVAAKGYDSVSASLVGDSEIQRTWPELMTDALDQCTIDDIVGYLDSYASAKNTEPLYYVDDPMVNGEVQYGRWRVAYVRRVVSGETFRIIQVLRRGYIKQVVDGSAIDWDEARRVKTKDSPAGGNTTTSYAGGDDPEYYLWLEWKNCSPQHANSIVASLRALNDDNWAPDLDGEDLGTGWHRLHISSNIEEDGSATVAVLLAQPEFTIGAYGTWLTSRQFDRTYLWNVPKTLAQGIVDAAKAKGISVTCNYNDDMHLVDIVIQERDYTGESLIGDIAHRSCDRVDTKHYYWGIGDASASAYDVPSTYSPGWTYDKRVRDNGDGSKDVELTYTQKQYREYLMRARSTSALATTDEYHQKGVTQDSQIPSIASPAVGLVYDQDIRPNDDCSRDVVTRGTTSVARDIYFPSRNATLMERDAKMYKNSRTMIQAPANSLGLTHDARNEFNRDGTYDGSIFYNRSKAQTAEFRDRYTPFKERRQILYENSRTKIEAPNTNATGLYDVNQRINDDGTYDGSLTYERGTQQGKETFVRSTSELDESLETLFKNWDTAQDAIYSTQGNLYDARNSLNEDGTYNSSTIYTHSQYARMPFDKAKTIFARTRALLYKNARSKIEAPELYAGQGGMYNVASQSFNRDGTYDGTLVYTEPLYGAFGTFARQRSSLFDRDSMIYKHSPDAIQAASSSQGTLYEATNSLNDDGSYDGQLTQQTSTASDLYIGFEGNLGTHQIYVSRNQTGIPAAISNLDSTYRPSVSGSINQDGTYDFVVHKRPANGVTAWALESSGSMEFDTRVRDKDGNVVKTITYAWERRYTTTLTAARNWIVNHANYANAVKQEIRSKAINKHIATLVWYVSEA